MRRVWVRKGEQRENHSQREDNAEVRCERSQRSYGSVSCREESVCPRPWSSEGEGGPPDSDPMLSTTLQQAESKVNRGELRRKK